MSKMRKLNSYFRDLCYTEWMLWDCFLISGYFYARNMITQQFLKGLSMVVA